MLRRTRLVLPSLLFSISAAFGAQVPSLDVVEAAPGILVYRPATAIGNSTSLAIVGDRQTILVDTSFPDSAPLIREDLAERGAPPVEWIVTTHAHRDHADALPFWLSQGARALAPRPQRGALEEAPPIRSALELGEAALPTLWFEESFELEVTMEGAPVVVEVLRPQYRSGHTGGDCLVHVPSRGLVYVGDYFFLDRFPIIDPPRGGSVDGYFSNLEWIAEEFPESHLVLPGHNTFAPNPVELPKMERFVAWAGLVNSSMERIFERRSQGEDVDTLVSEGLGPEFTGLSEKPRFLSEERWIRGVWSFEPERVDFSTLEPGEWFDFLEGHWSYEFSAGRGEAWYTVEPASGALRESVRGEIGGRSFSGSSIKFVDPEKDEWVDRWIDSMGHQLEGRVRVEDYGESDIPALVSELRLEGSLLRHVWYDATPTRFETDLLASSDEGETWKLIRRMPYIRISPARVVDRP